MARNEMHDLHNKILRKYHTMCGLAGLKDYEKVALLEQYGVESSTQLETHDLIDLCGFLQKRIDERSGTAHAEMDALRKRCIKALCMYIDAKGIETTDKIAYVKEMACRSAKKKVFNKLTAAELRGVIGYFNNERQAFEGAKSEAGKAPATRANVVYIPLSGRGEA